MIRHFSATCFSTILPFSQVMKKPIRYPHTLVAEELLKELSSSANGFQVSYFKLVCGVGLPINKAVI
jgi:hypothetical protein